MAYNQKAMYKDAIFVLEKRGEISKNNSRLIAELGYAYALSGQTDKAQQMIKELNELRESEVRPIVDKRLEEFTELGKKGNKDWGKEI